MGKEKELFKIEDCEVFEEFWFFYAENDETNTGYELLVEKQLFVDDGEDITQYFPPRCHSSQVIGEVSMDLKEPGHGIWKNEFLLR